MVRHNLHPLASTTVHSAPRYTCTTAGPRATRGLPSAVALCLDKPRQFSFQGSMLPLFSARFQGPMELLPIYGILPHGRVQLLGTGGSGLEENLRGRHVPLLSIRKVAIPWNSSRLMTWWILVVIHSPLALFCPVLNKPRMTP